MTHHPYPPAQPHRPRRWPAVLGAAALLLLAFVGCAALISPPPTSSPAVPAAAPAAAAEDGIGDGTWIVGTDIEPGTYRSTGARPGLIEFCAWFTRDGASSNSDIIDFGSANAGEPLVVEIGDGVRAFETNGCDTWTLVPSGQPSS